MATWERARIKAAATTTRLRDSWFVNAVSGMAVNPATPA